MAPDPVSRERDARGGVTNPTPRLATDADNAALLDLFGEVPMRGELVLATKRSPDFFSLYRMQKVDPVVYVGDTDTGIMGMCTALIRDGWLDGRVQKVGYLGDLRVRFDRSRAFARFFGDYFEALCERTGCSQYYTSLLASNRAAVNALTKKRAKRGKQPHYELLRPFTTVSVQLTWKPKRTTNVPVTSATANDLPAITGLLHDDHRQRPFGYRFDDGELEHRLSHWPGFSLDDVLVAKDSSGAVTGVLPREKSTTGIGGSSTNPDLPQMRRRGDAHRTRSNACPGDHGSGGLRASGILPMSSPVSARMTKQ